MLILTRNGTIGGIAARKNLGQNSKLLNDCRKRPCPERMTNDWTKFRRLTYKAFEETLRKLLPFKEWCLEAMGALRVSESPLPT